MSEVQPVPIAPPGGVVKTESDRVIEGRFSDCDKVRFVLGSDGRARPEKVGGRVRSDNVSAASGTIRRLHAWRDFVGSSYMAAGSETKLYAYDGAFARTDITPGAFSGGSGSGGSGLGWGIGTWGSGTWGTARPASSGSTDPLIWSLDSFGQILLATYPGGSVYSFDPTAAQPWSAAALVATSPNDCRGLFVTAERFVVALRANMTISWCSQGDYTVWTPLVTNTANTRTLQEGTKLIGGRVLGPKVSMIWSDAAAFLMQWTGNKYIHDTNMVGRDCGLIGPNAAVTVGGIAYWQGTDTFWMYDGSVRPMPNVMDIRRYVFDSISTSNAFQCYAVYNPRYQEIWFYYTVAGQANPTRYVIYSIPGQNWAPGTDTRTAGTHFTKGDTSPYYADVDGHIYKHESGNDDNGSAMPWSLTLAPYALQEGRFNVAMQGILLDVFEQSGNINLVLNTWDRLTDGAPIDTETDVISPTDGLIDTRLAGRYLGLNMSSSDLGSYFRLGKPAAFIQTIGDRT